MVHDDIPRSFIPFPPLLSLASPIPLSPHPLSPYPLQGTGDHCCEYMTGGCVVSLGPVGRNVAAGMTGGLGYFFDAEGDFTDKVGVESLDYCPVWAIFTRATGQI